MYKLQLKQFYRKISIRRLEWWLAGAVFLFSLLIGYFVDTSVYQRFQSRYEVQIFSSQLKLTKSLSENLKQIRKSFLTEHEFYYFIETRYNLDEYGKGLFLRLINSQIQITVQSQNPYAHGKMIGLNPLMKSDGSIISVQNALGPGKPFVAYSSEEGQQFISAFVYVPDLKLTVNLNQPSNEFAHAAARFRIALIGLLLSITLIASTVTLVFTRRMIVPYFLYLNEIYIERQAEFQDALLRLTTMGVTAESPEKLYQDLLGLVEKLFRCSFSWLILRDTENGIFSLAAEKISSKYKGIYFEFPIQNTIIIQTSQTKKITVVDNFLSERTDNYVRKMIDHGFYSVILVPLLIQNEVKGILGLNFDHALRQDEKDATLLQIIQIFANQTAAVIEQNRLVDYIQRQAQHMLAVIECAADGIFLTDDKGRIVEANLAAERILGISRSELSKQDLSGDFWHAKRLDGMKLVYQESAIARAILEQKEVLDEEFMVTIRGDSKIISLSAAPILGKGKISRGGIVTFRDITMHHWMEQQLAQNNRELTKILDLMKASTESLDIHKVFHRMFSHIMEIFDLRRAIFMAYLPDKKEIYGVTGLEIDPQLITQFRLPISQFPLVLKSFETKKVVMQKDLQGMIPKGNFEKFKITSGVVFPLLSEDEVIGFVAADRKGEPFELDEEQLNRSTAIINQTAVALKNALLYQEIQKTNQELEIKKQDLETIIYTISHDLKTPLASIDTYASVLERDHGSKMKGDVKYYFEAIRKNAKHTMNLIDDLLDISRLGYERWEMEKVKFDYIVDEAFFLAQPIYQKKDANFQRQKNLPEVICNRKRLVQVVENLLTNAAKFVEDNRKPEIFLGYQARNGEHVFFVRDNGMGIDSKNQAKIFDLFYRLNPSKDIEGTGVGLAIVQKIINKHGGRVWVESKSPDGSTFYFTIPSNLTATELKP